MTIIGEVSELRRYPIKSMLGETLEKVRVLARGLSGDRVGAFIDRETGKVASAKLPQRWRRLLECRATYADTCSMIDIEFPDGSRFDPAADGAAVALSALLGREVTAAFSRSDGLELDRANPEEVALRGATSAVSATILKIGSGAPAGGFFDAAPVHLVTTASLRRVAERSLARTSEPARFRPNIVIDSFGQPPFAENGWVGSNIAIGNDLRLKVLLPTPRCAVPTLAHGDMGPDPRLALEIAALNKVRIFDKGMMPCLGAYAQVEQPGEIAVGDRVALVSACS